MPSKQKATTSECPNAVKFCGVCCQCQQEILNLRCGEDLRYRITKVTVKKKNNYNVNSFSQLP